ncbi:MAG: hypothetical protein KBD53_09405 [Candidatus Omnitrophica bacterium]|nr:hypothetical protein [Candidatus Omnitrophota bacterium]
MKNAAKLTQFVLLGLIFISSRFSYAETADKIADSFYEHGQKMMEEGNSNDAINDFSRAFLLNPADTRLHEALKSLSHERNVTASQKMDLILLEDLLDYTGQLKEKSGYYKYKRNALGEELMQKGFERSFFEKEMSAIDVEQKSVLDQEEADIKERYAKGEDPLKVIHASLKLENKRLQGEIELFEKQYNRLREINAKNGYIQGEVAILSLSDFSQQQASEQSGESAPPVINVEALPSSDVQPEVASVTPPVEIEPAVENEPIVMTPPVAEVEPEPAADVQPEVVAIEPPAVVEVEAKPVDETDTGAVAGLLGETKTKLDDMLLALENRDEKIDKMSKELIALSLELEETKSKEEDKKNDLNDLRDEMVEVESKNLLLQRFQVNYQTMRNKMAQMKAKLAENDNQIKELNEKVKDLSAKKRGRFSDKPESRDKEIAEYQEQIKKLKKESEDMVKFKNEVDNLKDSLSRAQKYQDEVQTLREQVAKLKQNELKQEYIKKTLAKKDQIIDKQSKDLVLKDKQIVERDKSIKALNEKVKDVESRLEEAQNVIKEKDEKLQKLQKQLLNNEEKYVKNLEDREKEFNEKLSQIQKDSKYAQQFSKAEKNDKLDKELASKNKEITTINGILAEYKGQLAEKDERIAKLEASDEKDQADNADDKQGDAANISSDREQELLSVITKKDDELKEITNTIALYRENLDEANKDIVYQKQQIDDLTQELARLDEKVLARDRLSKEKIDHIELLKQLLQQEKEKRSERNDNLREMVQKKTMEMKELEGMLEIYKLKLKDTHVDVQEKEKMMGDLQDQLDNVNVEVYQKSEVINKTHHNLVVLKDQLAEIYQRLAELQSLSAEEQKIPAVNDEIQSLQTKINDINSFLKGEIDTMDVNHPDVSESGEDSDVENVVTNE